MVIPNVPPVYIEALVWGICGSTGPNLMNILPHTFWNHRSCNSLRGGSAPWTGCSLVAL